MLRHPSFSGVPGFRLPKKVTSKFPAPSNSSGRTIAVEGRLAHDPGASHRRVAQVHVEIVIKNIEPRIEHLDVVNQPGVNLQASAISGEYHDWRLIRSGRLEQAARRGDFHFSSVPSGARRSLVRPIGISAKCQRKHECPEIAPGLLKFGDVDLRQEAAAALRRVSTSWKTPDPSSGGEATRRIRQDCSCPEDKPCESLLLLRQKLKALALSTRG